MPTDENELARLVDKFVRDTMTPAEVQELAKNSDALKAAEELRELRATLRALPAAERINKLLDDRPDILERLATEGPLPSDSISPAEALRRVRERAAEQERNPRGPEQDHGPSH